MFSSAAEAAMTIRGLPGILMTLGSPNAIYADKISAKSMLATSTIQRSDSFSSVFILIVYQKTKVNTSGLSVEYWSASVRA